VGRAEREASDVIGHRRRSNVPDAKSNGQSSPELCRTHEPANLSPTESQLQQLLRPPTPLVRLEFGRPDGIRRPFEHRAENGTISVSGKFWETRPLNNLVVSIHREEFTASVLDSSDLIQNDVDRINSSRSGHHPERTQGTRPMVRNAK